MINYSILCKFNIKLMRLYQITYIFTKIYIIFDNLLYEYELNKSL